MISSSQTSFEVSENGPHLSIVIPAYNEEENLEELHKELMEILPQLDMGWELIIVDDGSKDETWEKIKAIHKRDSRIKGVRFSRNFGHQYALFAGLAHARGQAIITMDADLQHPPDMIPKLIAEWRKGNKIVNTIRLDPEDFSFMKKITSKIFYKIFSFLSGVQIRNGMADFRLLDRQVLDNVLRFRENGLFLRGIVQWLGFQSTELKFNCHDRFSGSTKYSLSKMVRFALTALTSFSLVPLRLGIVIGILTSLIAFYHLAYALYAKIILQATVPGWATTVSILSFMFGILFILLGLVGEYVGRMITEVRSRPRFVVCDEIGIKQSLEDSHCPDHTSTATSLARGTNNTTHVSIRAKEILK